MKKIYKLFTLLSFLLGLTNVASAQVVILDETLTTQESFNNFTVVSVLGGNHTWYFNLLYPQNGATASGYTNPNSYENEDWLISPELYLSEMNSAKLTFDHTRGNASVINVGVAEGWYQVFATANYTDNPTTTQWIELEGITHTTSAWSWVSSGELEIPAAAQSANTRIAFRYRSSNTQSATWEVKNVQITGTPISNGEDGVFKIITLNVEEFGSTCDDKDDELQMNNVVNAILMMNPDIVCLQEVTQSTAYPAITTLVSRLGGEWGSSLVASSTQNCSMNQGIVYKKSKVQLAGNPFLLNSGNTHNSNYSYSYAWSSGRYPAVYNVNLVINSELIPISIVNIHAKSATDETSYNRRYYASQALKEMLDGATYNSKNLIILGDFNDYLEGTNCTSCGNISPYQNFIVDVDNYKGLTANLQNYNCKYLFYYDNPTIDNIIISDELFDNYVPNSVKSEIDIVQSIPEYGFNTTNHAPISALFKFNTTTGLNNVIYTNNENRLQVHPNPGRGIFTVHNEIFTQNDEIEIFSLTGLLLNKYAVQSATTVIDLTTSPEGYYLVKIRNKTAKVVKQF